MDDDLMIPLRISGRDFESTAFPGHVGFQLRPPGSEGGFSARDWPFGDGNLFATMDGHVANLGVPIHPVAEPANVTEPEASTANEIEVRLPFKARISARRSAGPDETWVAVIVEDVQPAQWTALEGAPLYIATDASGVLAELRFAVPVRHPQKRRLRFASEQGWQGGASTWVAQDGTRALGVNLHRAMPVPMIDINDPSWGEAQDSGDPSACATHELAMDGNGGLVLVDDHLEGLDGQAIDGPVDLPTPDAELEELKVMATIRRGRTRG